MIRLASPADLPAIADIYDAILTREESGGPVYTNWQRGKYPTVDTARQALDDGTLYVGEDAGLLWGVVNLNDVQLPEYGDIPWTIPAELDQVGVIHTLCIHPAQAGRGLRAPAGPASALPGGRCPRGQRPGPAGTRRD